MVRETYRRDLFSKMSSLSFIILRRARLSPRKAVVYWNSYAGATNYASYGTGTTPCKDLIWMDAILVPESGHLDILREKSRFLNSVYQKRIEIVIGDGTT